MGFILFSPIGLVGVGRAAHRAVPHSGRSRQPPWPGAARPTRRAAAAASHRALQRSRHGHGSRRARASSSSFGGIHAVDGVNLRGRGPHAARPDRSQRRRQDHGLQSDLRACYPPGRRAAIELEGRSIAGLRRSDITRAGVGRSFQITNLFPLALRCRRTCVSRCRRVIAKRFASVGRRPRARRGERARRRADQLPRPRRHGAAPRPASLSYRSQRLLERGDGAATTAALLLLDEPLAGLAAAERERIGRADQDDLVRRCRCCSSSTTSIASSRSPTTSP